MKKRVLSGVMALSVVMGMLPAGLLALPAAAADTTDKAASVESTGLVYPEVGILNKYNWSNQDFYDLIKDEQDNSPYNAIWMFNRGYSWEESGNGTWRWLNNDIGDGSGAKALEEYSLSKLMAVKGNLDANLSAVLTNNHHTHKQGKWTVEVNAWHSVTLSITGNEVLTISGADSAMSYDSSYYRVGDLQFSPITYNASKATQAYKKDAINLDFHPQEATYYVEGKYYQKQCGGTSAKDLVLCFRDIKDPKVTSISYSTDEGESKTWTDSTRATTRVVAGQRVYIKLTFDEPIRFAGRESSNLNELYILLQEDNESTGTGQKAYLYKNDGQSLYFRYTVNEAEFKNDPTRTITTLDASPLFTALKSDNGSIALTQVYGSHGGYFDVSVPSSAGSSLGYTTSECYITDIAGNPMSQKTLSNANLVLDTQSPYVEKIQFSANTNNAALKSSLTVDGVPLDHVKDGYSYDAGKVRTTTIQGQTVQVIDAVPKDQLKPGTTTYAQNYADTSDTYLGAGDSLSITIQMNEKLKLDLPKVGKNTLLSWKYATATTNLKAPAGYQTSYFIGVDDKGYITVKSTMLNPYTHNGRDGGDKTVITLAELPIVEGMTVEDEAREIKLTKLTFAFPNEASSLIGSGGNSATYNYYEQVKDYLTADGCVTDLAGNKITDNTLTLASDASALGGIAANANENPYRLDVKGLTVGAIEGSYQETASNNGFRYGFRLTDPDTGGYQSDYQGIPGTFLLKNGGDGVDYAYEYALTADSTADLDNLTWKQAVLGVSVSFPQTPEVYLYVRPKEGESYGDLRECTLTVTAWDYAGNGETKTLPESGSLDWYVDTTAPTVTAGQAQRVFESGTGTLSAQVDLTDRHGLSAWQYAWGESSAAVPADDDWKTGTLTPTTGNTTVTVTTAPDDFTVQEEESLARYLWVKAVDNSAKTAGQSNNTTEAICLGQYVYDLTKAKYSLTYSGGITAQANVVVGKLEEGDALVFLVPYTQSGTAPNYYSVLTVTAASITAENGGDIFQMDGWRDYNNVSFTGNGAQISGAVSGNNSINNLLEGGYFGDLTVTVLSGKADGISDGTVGTGGYPFSRSEFTLKVAGSDPRKNYYKYPDTAYTDSFVSLSGPGLDTYIIDASYWNGTTIPYEQTMNATLEGGKLLLTIENDQNGWLCEDLDIGRSYILLTNNSDQTEYQVPIKAFAVNQSGEGALATQTVTIPAASALPGSTADTYTTGTYSAELLLYFKSDAVGSYPLSVGLETQRSENSWSKLMVVDTTQARGIQVASIRYTPKEKERLALSRVYDEQTITLSGDGVYYLPVSGGSVFPSTTGYTLDLTAEDDAPTTIEYSGKFYSYAGIYRVELWNEAKADNKLIVTPSEDQKSAAAGFSIGTDAGGCVTLIPNEENLIHIRKFYSNGAQYETTITVKPVEEHLTGSLSIDDSANDLVFTPTEESMAVSFLDAKVYAFAYANGVNYESPGETDDFQLLELALSEDGTWRCSLPEEGAQFRVFTVSSHGSVWADSKVYASQRTPWFTDAKLEDHADGTYTLSFDLHDDYATMDGQSPELTIGFDQGYTANTFRFTMDDLEEPGINEIAEVWRTGNQASATGIYEVLVSDGQQNWGDDVSTYYDYWQVTVRGVYLPGTSGKDLGVTITARDASGRVGTQEVSATSAQKAIEVTHSELTGDGLKLTFNQPVLPTETWAWTDSDDQDTNLYENSTYVGTVYKGYKTQWSGAFPITANGTHEIAVRDLSGGTQYVSVDTSAFTVDSTDWSVSLDWSETALTDRDVTLTAALIAPGLPIYGLYLRDGTREILVPDGYYNGTETEDTMGKDHNGWAHKSSVPWSEYNKYATSTPRSVTLRANDDLTLEVCCSRYSDGYSKGVTVFTQRIHVDNIAKTAPAAAVHYYVQSTGRSFTAEEFAQYVGEGIALQGSVTASYTTDWTVTPTSDDDGTYTFTPDNYQTAPSYTFSYQDDLGHAGSVTATLPAALTLKPKSAGEMREIEQVKDTQAPVVTVGIYAKCSEVYTAAETFAAQGAWDDETALAETFSNMGWVQGFRLVLTVSDNSPTTVTVTGTGSGALPEGVSRTGNILTVDAAEDFTVTAADSEGNTTSFTIPATVLQKLDTTAPTANITMANGSSVYDKNLYVALNDASGTAYLASPSGLTRESGGAYDGQYKYVATDNRTVTFVFYDEAGNRGSRDFTVTGVDMDPPALTTLWSPPMTYTNADNEPVVDTTQPTGEAVNTNITALIDSDRAMSALKVEVGYLAAGGTEVQLLSSGAAVTGSNPYILKDSENRDAVILKATPERITVTYCESTYQPRLLFTATAPNGVSSTAEIDVSYLNIDRLAPTITPVVTPVCREGYTVPYAVEVELTPDEPVTSSNYGAMENHENPKTGTTETTQVTYTEDQPLKLTFTANGSYQVSFADEAGNSTVESVSVTGIDRTAPVITKGELLTTGSGQSQSASIELSLDEAGTITVNGAKHQVEANVAQTVQFTQNGAYLITAADLAGNMSTATVAVGSIDKVLPTISFADNTLYALQNSAWSELKWQLESGYTVSDNATAAEALVVSCALKTGESLTTGDAMAGMLAEAGLYEVVYTVADEAGNEAQASRFVQIIGEDTLCVQLDGKLILPGGTVILRAGQNCTLTLRSCNEPYSIKARQGIHGVGQMKYLTGSSISFADDGSFTVPNSSGYYTLLVTTQSRQTILIRLYIER